MPEGTILKSPEQEYKIIKILGVGSFGITYLVTSSVKYGNLSFDLKFVIKEFFIDSCMREGDHANVRCTPTTKQEFELSKADFLKEARLLKSICQKSKNIVKVNEAFEANGTVYYVMEYLDGGNPGKMTEAEALKLIRELALAVDVLHKNNILHLDIKPENIVMKTDQDGSMYPVLIDFGIVKHFDKSGNPTSRMHAKGASSGYAPIEQYDTIRTFSPTLDIYALGAVLFYLLTGTNPPNAFEHLNNPVIIESKLPATVSEKTANAIKKAMTPNQSQRTQNISEFIADLGIEYKPSVQITGGTKTEVLGHGSKPKRKLLSYIGIGIVVGLLIFGIVMLCLPNNNTDAILKEAISYLNNKEYEKAIPLLEQAASKDNAEAIYYLAETYYYGYGQNEDMTKAAELLQRAAELGNASAQNNLGVSYQYGDGVAEDYFKAAEWYEKAAMQGNAYAQNNLGECYEKGIGVAQSYTKAKEWYEKSAEQGNAAAQYNLAYIYKGGKEIPVDFEKAFEWFQKSALQGNMDSQLEIGNAYFFGEGVTKDLEEAAKWFEKSAKQGNGGAQFNLGVCFEEGYGVPKSYSRAVEWYEKAALQGHNIAQANLGNCYENGIGTTKNLTKAIEWYEKAAVQGNEYAQESLERLKNE